MTQREIPCLFMRGGTSRGPFFDLEDLPTGPAVRDRVLQAAMGSPDARQVDGLGGATSLTSKVAIVGRSDRPDVDVDYLFAQVSIDKPIVDTAPSCGNMLAGVGPFAIERGFITPTGDETRVRIFNVNTQCHIEALIQTPGGKVTYEGNQRIDGVPGSAAAILLNFSNVVGSKCAGLLPTGVVKEVIDAVAVTCIDVAMPMVLIRAADLGISGYETQAFDSNQRLMQRIEGVRLVAGERMGLGDVTDSVIPKVGILARARDGGIISSRYLTPHALHAAHAVTGAICVATCTSIKGSVAWELATSHAECPGSIQIEHASGAIDVALETAGNGENLDVLRAGVVRTARKIMDGRLFVPAAVWPSND
jgi:4-oxalomesaconate tautomerase